MDSRKWITSVGMNTFDMCNTVSTAPPNPHGQEKNQRKINVGTNKGLFLGRKMQGSVLSPVRVLYAIECLEKLSERHRDIWELS